MASFSNKREITHRKDPIDRSKQYKRRNLDERL